VPQLTYAIKETNNCVSSGLCFVFGLLGHGLQNKALCYHILRWLGAIGAIARNGEDGSSIVNTLLAVDTAEGGVPAAEQATQELEPKPIGVYLANGRFRRNAS